MEDQIGEEQSSFEQTTEDKQQIAKIINRLDKAQKVGIADCVKYGVKT